MRTGSKFGSWLLALALLLSACSSSGKGTGSGTEPTGKSPQTPPPAAEGDAKPKGPKVQGSLIFAQAVDPKTLDPHRMVAASEDQIASFIGASLVIKAPDGRMVPYLANEWQFSDDGQTLTFTLKDGIKFHSGRPLTAADFKSTWERAMDPATPSPVTHDLLSAIETIEVPDEKTLVLKLKLPNLSVLANLAEPGYLQPIDPDMLAKYGEEYGRHPSSVGPYRLKDWQVGQKVVLERNPDFNWGPSFYEPGAPYLATLEFRTMPDEATQIAAFETGELSILSISPDRWQEYQAKPSVQFFRASGGTVNFLAVNLTNPVLSDLRVRQAISHAMDRNVLIEAGYNGGGKPGHSPIAPVVFGYKQATEKAYPYDQARAKQLLDEAGWTGGPVRQKDGKPLELRLLTAASNNLLAELVQAQLKQVGITTKIVSLETSAARKMMFEGDYDLTYWGLSWTSDPGTLMRFIAYTGGGYNPWQYSNPAMDKLIDSYDASFDQGQRERLAGEMQQLWVDEVASVVLAYPQQGVAVLKKYNGVTYSPDTGYIGFENAYLND